MSDARSGKPVQVDPHKDTDSPIVDTEEEAKNKGRGGDCVWGGTYANGAHVCDRGIDYVCSNGAWL